MSGASPTPQQAADAMYERDHAARALGITVDAVGAGTSTLSMTIGPDMVNGHDICHGGYIFTLADTAFAYACNSYGPTAVAATATIEFLAPGRNGERLVAEAVERHKAGRTGYYDVAVHNPAGEVIALFTGRSKQVGDRPL